MNAPPIPSLLGTLQQQRMMAIIRIRDQRSALDTAEALAQAGITLMEITIDSTDALSALQHVRAQHPQVSLGAGTILTVQQAELAQHAGAQFLVTPAVRPDVSRWCQKRQMPLITGAFTPTEVLQAWEQGATAVKLFPARAGGLDLLRMLRDPLPHIPLIAVGGIHLKNARDYLQHGAVAVGVGGALTERASQRSELQDELMLWKQAVL